MAEYASHSEAETLAIAKEFAASLAGGEIIALTGELGAGKTTFVKGLAKGLGVTKEIVSPTFSIMNVLPANKGAIKNLVHVDTYRLKNPNELDQIGLADYLGAADTVCVIEWPEIAEKLFADVNKKITVVEIQPGDKSNERQIIIED